MSLAPQPNAADLAALAPTPQWRRVLRRLWFQLNHSRMPEPVSFRSGPFQLTVPRQSLIIRGLYCNSFERIERSIFLPLIGPNCRFFDIGANIGYYALAAAKLIGQDQAVCAIEPCPSTFELLLKNVQQNNMSRRIDCRQIAVSDKPGTTTLRIFESSGGVYNSLGATTDPLGQKYSTEIPVQTTSIDQLMTDLPDDQPIVGKIDVEGYEQPVIQGGDQTFQRLKHACFMIELNDDATTQAGFQARHSAELVQQAGFNVYQIMDIGRLARRKVEQFDQLFAPDCRSNNVIFAKGSFDKRIHACHQVVD